MTATAEPTTEIGGRKPLGQQVVRILTTTDHKLIGKLSQQRRIRITLEVRETNLAAQLFFRSRGFRAVSVLRSFYDDTPEDAYLMQYRYRPIEVEVEMPANRIRRAG